MTFTSSAALLDAVVLAVVSREEQGTYGYRITQQIKEVLDLSESALYPVLRRLQKDQCLTVYDETSTAATAATTKRHPRVWSSWTATGPTGKSTAKK